MLIEVDLVVLMRDADEGSIALLKLCSFFPALPAGEKRTSKSAPVLLALAQSISRAKLRKVSGLTCSTTKPHLSAPW
jgi:hypothetical protein